MYCRNCGKELAENTAVCPECGEVLMPNPSSYQQNQNTGSSYSYDSTTGNYTYGTPNPNQNYGSFDPEEKKGNGVAIASLVLGILSLVTCCCSPILNLPLAIAALVCGIMGRNSQNKGMAIAGIVLGVIGVILGILSAILMIVMEPYMIEFLEEMEFYY